MFEGTRSHHGIFVNFDKICVFYDKYCVCIDKYVFIIVKIKRINSDKICVKVNFIIKHIILSEHTQILQILTRLTRQSCSGPKNFPNV